jgi:S-adenosylmethionine synthetase
MVRKGLQKFTSESVSEGHPDKVCDQISDGVLDECLRRDKNSRVACEVFATTDTVIVGGEITTEELPDIEKIVRSVVKEVGYTRLNCGFDYQTLQVQQLIQQQSPDIAMGVNSQTSSSGKQGAGDQGMMFGYACSETAELMPAPLMYCHRLLKRAALLRKEDPATFLRPDSKAQVTLIYEGGNPVKIDTVVLSHQHAEGVGQKELADYIKTEIIRPTLEPYRPLHQGNSLAPVLVLLDRLRLHGEGHR